MRGFWVTGTDTGVGKTLVSCALMHALRRAGHAPVPMKPVASGCTPTPQGLQNDDVTALLAATSHVLNADDIAPFRFEPPIAPHIAAAQAGVAIDIGQLLARAAELARLGPLVVEGAGGFLVPLDDRFSLADLAVALDLPVVLVVGLRLGCLNHALLTVEAIERRGLTLAGWVGNTIEPGFESASENLATLRERISAPCLATIPWRQMSDPQAEIIAIPH